MFRLFYALHEGGLAGSLVAGLGFLFSLWMAYDCWRRNGDGYWIWLILCTGGVFALIYFFTQYWQGSRMEHRVWQRFAGSGQLRDLRLRAGALDTAAGYETLGDALLSARRYPEAETAYRAALQRQPELFEAQVRLGYALLEQKRTDEAWPLLGQCYQQKPEYDSGHLAWQVARCQARRGNLQDARALYRYFLTRQSYSEARIEYAQVLFQAGEREEARAVLTELLREIEFSPRFTRARERPWRRAAKRLLKTWV